MRTASTFITGMTGTPYHSDCYANYLFFSMLISNIPVANTAYNYSITLPGSVAATETNLHD